MTSGAAALRRLSACPACGGSLDGETTRCIACGSELFLPERRVVTVVFADLAGYTRLCSTTDHEAVHLLIRPLMNGIRRVFHELGAVVPVIEGDGCMAVFGAREGREDDPARAVLAAARVQQLVDERRAVVGLELPPLRVGVNLGEALVAPSWESSGFSVTGDTVNVASRLCTAAREGSVLVSSAVVAAVPGTWWGESAVLTVKNRAEPLDASPLLWQSLSLTSVSQRPLSDTRFAERPELARARDALASGVSVVLVGEPGIGKSRLLQEAAAAVQVPAVHGAAPSFLGEGLLAAWAHGIRSLLAGGRSTAVVSDLEERRLRRLVGETVDSTEEDSDADLVAALDSVVRKIGRATGLLVVADDLQWAQDEELALLAGWAAPAAAGLAVLAASREPGSLAGVGEVVLAPLEGEQQTALVRALLPGADEVLVAALSARCGGIPLYVEQCVRLLLEDGTLEQTLEGVRTAAPDRLHQLPVHMRLFVTSRLDRLPADVREVLSVAAVIGERVDVDLLRYLTGLGSDVAHLLEQLVDAGMLAWAHEPGAQPQLAFRHAIVREVAYETLLRSRRLDVHRAAAEWYAVLPVSALLAEEAAHLEAAIALGGGDCATIRRAVQVLSFHALSVLEERPRAAATAVSRAALLAEEHPECGCDLLDLTLARAQLLLGAGDEAGALAQARALEDIARARPSPQHLATALLVQGRAQAIGAPDEAQRVLDLARDAYEVMDDRAGMARVEIARANCRHESLAPRIAAHEAAWVQAQRSADVRLVSQAAQDVLMHVPNRDLAQSDVWRERVQAALRPDDLLGRARLAFTDGLLARLRGDRAGAASTLLEVYGEGLAWQSIHLQWNAGLIAVESLALQGRAPEAVPVLEHLRPYAESRPHRRNAVDLDMHQALVEVRSGRRSAGQALLDRAEEEAQSLGNDLIRQAHAFQARVAFDTGRWSDVIDRALLVADLDRVLEQPVLGLEVRTLALAAHVCLRRQPTLQAAQSLRADLAAASANPLQEVAAAWWVLDEVLRGYDDVLEGLPPEPTTAESRALVLECRGLAGRSPELLLDAAETWAGLGTTIWQARSLLWCEVLTGRPQPAAHALLEELDVPVGTADRLRRQVEALRD